jgi:hypothetical protein
VLGFLTLLLGCRTTVRALQVSKVAGAFSGLAGKINAGMAVLLPLIWRLLF